MEITIEMAMENCKKELVESINNISNKYKISYYILEIILHDIYQEVNKNKQLQIINLKNKIKEGEENE